MKNSYWIVGKHSVNAILQNPSREIIEIISLKKEYFKHNNKKISYKIVNQKTFSKILDNNEIAHQGIAALVRPLKKLNFLEEIKKKELKNLIMLDEITDTRNIGSIMRNALAFNIDGIIINEKDFNEKSQSMHKASSGSLEKIKIFQVSNLSNAVDQLKKNNYWIIGLDGKANENVESFDWFDQNVFIFGSENKGIRKNILSKCDKVLKINISNKIESLNVSSATSAALLLLNLNQDKLLNKSGR